MENALLKGSKSRTEKDLIDGSIAKFGDVFSFGIDGPGFTNWSTEIDVTCHVCAIKRPNSKWHWDHNTPQLHLDKGCITCRYENNFLKKAKTKFPIEFDYSPVVYIDDKTHVNFICVKHGELISQRPKRHLDKDNKGGCKACCLEAKSNIEKHAKNFFDKAPVIHNGFYDYSKVVYQGSGVKVIIICPIHGEFPQTPDCHMQEKGCPSCGTIKITRNLTKEDESWHAEVYKAHGDRYKYPEKYVRGDLKINIECKDHGIFPQTAEHHKNGHGCPSCGYLEASSKKTFSNDMYIHNCEQRWPGKFSYHKTNYAGSDNPVTVTCNTCKNDIVKGSAGYHYYLGTCITCSPKSKGEAAIIEILQRIGIKFVVEFSIPDSLRRYDFMIPASDNFPKPVLIEYDGIQHFKISKRFHGGSDDEFVRKQQVDIAKTMDAIINGYVIIRIDHNITLVDEIETQLSRALRCAHDYDILVSSDLYEEHIREVINNMGYDLSVGCIGSLI